MPTATSFGIPESAVLKEEAKAKGRKRAGKATGR